MVILGATQAVPASAAGEDAFQFFQEEAKVITASRHEQSISDVPLAVDVITAEEIHASGAANIWDLLRFRVGMDVLDGRSGSGNRAVVSERGFPHEFASNLLVLVDGRNVYNADVAGVDWDQIPVQMQDVDRIEIIRGPNTAIYGTGAGVGVINILTKKPQGKVAVETDNRGGNLGMVQAYQAVEGSVQKLSLRVSHTFQQEGGFPLASDTAVTGDDFLHKNVANLRALLPLSDRSTMEFLSGGSWETLGLGGPVDGQRGDFDAHFETLKVSHQFSEDSALEVTSSRSDSISHAPVGNDSKNLRQLQYDEEIFHRFAWGDKHLDTTYGASYRNVVVTSPENFGNFNASPRLEIYRGYLQQTIKPVDKFTVQGGMSLESSNFAGLKPNYQIASVFAPAPEHAFRASYSQAYILRDFVPIFAYESFPPILNLGNSQLASSPYEITSYETGYHGRYLDRRLETDISLFHTQIDGFHTFLPLPPDFTTFIFQTYDDAIARGAELSLKYHFSSSRWVYANYTYEHITDTAGDRGLTTDNTPAHKVNVGGATDLGHGLSASVNVGYKDAYFISSEAGNGPLVVPAYWRVDARLGYVWPWYKEAELYVAGQNLGASTHQEFPDGLAIPRTYQGGVSIRFSR